MSRFAKMGWLVAGLSLLVLLISRMILGGWINVLFIPLGLFFAGFIMAIVFDIKMYIEFFSMKTTKKGMSMGLMILLAMILLVSVNFLAVRFNKTKDFTEENLNSLTDQSTKLLKGLQQDIEVKVFYRGQEAEDAKRKVKATLNTFAEESSKFKVRYYDSYVDAIEAHKYLNDLPDVKENLIFVFIENGGKKVRVDAPFGEEQVTSALIKATRQGEKRIYFTIGHGERNLESADAEGIKLFSMALKEASYLVEPLNLLEKAEIPSDASLVVIAGPTSQFQEGELNAIRNYAKSGGHLMIALDPGQRHNLANLTKTFGVEFANNFIMNEYNKQVGRSSLATFGLYFDPNNEITKPFPTGQNFTVFDFASEIRPANDRADTLKVAEIIKTDETSYAMNQPEKIDRLPSQKSFAVAIAVSGKVTAESKDFSAVIFGDSDFMTNKTFDQGLNRNLAMNAVASLTDEKDLISVRAKHAKGTKMTLTRTTQLLIVFGGMALPLILLIISAVVWFRRRGA